MFDCGTAFQQTQTVYTNYIFFLLLYNSTTFAQCVRFFWFCLGGRYGSVEGLTDSSCARTNGGDVDSLYGDSGGSLEIGSASYSSGCVGVVHGVGNGGLIGHTIKGNTNSKDGTGDMTSTTTQCGALKIEKLNM